MTDKMSTLLYRIEEAEKALDRAVTDWRQEIKRTVKVKVARVADEVRVEHKRLRRNLLSHIRSIGLLLWLTAPVVYGMIVPLALTDLCVTLYQHICFPVFRMARVRRSDYVVVDRHRLGYLNALEKLNCAYCGYGNGVIAYVREIASRTEQYFCPIKHAISVPGSHSRYFRFVEYGDARAYREQLAQLRQTAGEP